MKRAANILIGFIAGAIFMFSAQAFGAGNLTGTKVDGQKNVKLNDKSIGSAAVIAGTSYLPLRAIANELDMQVSVTADSINLTAPDGAAKEVTLEDLITQRTIIQNNINSTQDNIKGLTTNVIPSLQNATSKLDKQRLEIAESHLVDFQKQLADLQQQLVDINNQIQTAESQ